MATPGGAEGPRSALGDLPVAKWATRLLGGTVDLSGRLDAAVSVMLAEKSRSDRPVSLVIGPGDFGGELHFVGGAEPFLLRVQLRCERVELDGEPGTTLDVSDDGVALDSRLRPGLAHPRTGFVIDQVLARLADVRLSARAEPDGDLVLRLGHGVEVHIPAGVVLTVTGATMGPAPELQLCEPLVVGFGGDGLRLTHDQFRLLSKLANVRLARATLHPDGSVALEGSGGKAAELAMRAPLQRASARLSELVRRSPQFGRVRAFLKREIR